MPSSIAGLVVLGSPLVHGMDPVEPPQPPPATRLVLAVVDGLRADKAFENRMERMPFLRDKVLNKGRWGISHTRVPTESRPGHVAIIAGFYEDVSAVTKGWKMNPVEFDSLFNQSRHTWSFGSPDILPMFAYGASDQSKVEMFMYEAEAEDFAKDDASKLDTWVFDKFEDLLKRAEHNETLNALLHSDKIVFFLHLLGVDTNGHAHRPHSEEYSENIRIADAGLAKVELLIDSFYKRDGRTAFVVTADHGMGNRGAHGDGHPDNTQTPLVAWGAGIQGPDHDNPVGHDDLSQPWQLHDVQRNDVKQADIAPLMSTLIGVPYPKNSVGTLPLVYLEGSNRYKAEVAFGNAKQILAQVELKSAQKRQTEIIFKPFAPLIGYKRRIDAIHGKILSEKYEEAETESFALIELCLSGLRYYQTYDWLFLRSVISLGYIGWIVYSTVFLLKSYVKIPSNPVSSSKRTASTKLPVSNPTTINTAAMMTAFSIFGLLYMKESPFAYYLYVSFPIVFWSESLKQREFLFSLLRFYTTKPATKVTSTESIFSKVILPTISYIAALELLVYSYFQRWILTICLFSVGWIWPLFFDIEFRKRNSLLVWLWRLSCSLTSTFTVLSVELEENVLLIMMGGTAILILGTLGFVLIPRYVQSDLPSFSEEGTGPRTRSRTRSGGQVIQSNSDSTWVFVGIQLCLNFISMLLVMDTSRSLQLKQGLPLMNAICSWAILGFSVMLPIIDQVRPSQHYLKRLLVIFLAFAPVFILLSVSYEALFYASLSATLLLWMLVEKQLYGYIRSIDKGEGVYQEITDEGIKRSFELSDLRRATFFLMLINMAFFGTGNIASISSFSLESVYRFTTIFDPFLMAALLVLKILIPFFVTSAIFGLLSRLIDLPLFSLYLLVMSTTDIMTLNFFFLVRDDGSWLEIGTTISHFIIASAFIVFQILLFSISHWLIGNVLIPKQMDRVLEMKKRH